MDYNGHRLGPARTRHPRSDGASAPYPPRSPSKQSGSRYTTRRTGRSPQFVNVSSASPEPHMSSSDEDGRPTTRAFSGVRVVPGTSVSPDLPIIMEPMPVLVQTEADDSRARIASVNLPVPSQTSPPLPQQDDTVLDPPIGERPSRVIWSSAPARP